MKLSTTLFTVLPTLASANPTNQLPNTALAPSFVQVENVQAAGTGCPPGSLDLSVTNNGNQISLAFGQFVAFSPTDLNSNKRRFCQVNFKVRYPPGWALTVASTNFEGYIGIDGGLRAELVSSYYFGGSSNGGNDPSSKLSVQGPYYQDYNVVSGIGAQLWSPCGQDVILNLKTDIRLIGDGAGVISTERQKSRFFNLVNLDWRQC